MWPEITGANVTTEQSVSAVDLRSSSVPVLMFPLGKVLHRHHYDRCVPLPNPQRVRTLRKYQSPSQSPRRTPPRKESRTIRHLLLGWSLLLLRCSLCCAVCWLCTSITTTESVSRARCVGGQTKTSLPPTRLPRYTATLRTIQRILIWAPRFHRREQNDCPVTCPRSVQQIPISCQGWRRDKCRTEMIRWSEREGYSSRESVTH